MTDLLPTGFVAIGEEAGSARRTRIVLDTSVLIADPSCVMTFDDTDVVIPLTVVEELDGLKTRPDDVGRAARTARCARSRSSACATAAPSPTPSHSAAAACRSRSTGSASIYSSSTASIR